MKELLVVVQGYAIKIGISLLIIIVGFIIAKNVKKILVKAMDKTKLDDTSKPFIASLIYNVLRVVIVVFALENVVEGGSSLAAILASAGLAIGLAFQGSLANFAGGILLLILRPFKVGDLIEVNGHKGIVESVQVFNTTLKTFDNCIITMPNGPVSNADITNYSAKDQRRVDLTFGVGYEQDVDRVKAVLLTIASEHELILKDPEPFVRLSEHGDSAVMFVVRVWTNSEDYWTVYFDLLETVKKRFDEEEISIPYPQLDVHTNA